MKNLKFSARLNAVIDLLDRRSDREQDGKAAKHFACVADVGCDHGFVSIALIERGIAGAVIASDVRKGPLSRAEEHIAEYGMTDRINTVLSDGMRHLSPGEADGAVIAGMGGLLMRDIISEAAGRGALPGVLVLQPQSHPQELREMLRELGYAITDEDMVLEDGKFYPIIRAEGKASKERSACTESPAEKSAAGEEKTALRQQIEDLFGPCLLKGGHPVLRTYLQKQKEQFSRILADLPQDHVQRAEIEEKLRLLEAARRRL